MIGVELKELRHDYWSSWMRISQQSMRDYKRKRMHILHAKTKRMKGMIKTLKRNSRCNRVVIRWSSWRARFKNKYKSSSIKLEGWVGYDEDSAS